MTTLTASTAPAVRRSYTNYARPLWQRLLLTREMAIIALLLLCLLYTSPSPRD